MPKENRKTTSKNSTAANLGYETELWQMADALRGSMDAAEYKHVVLGLIFLKYISDAFEEQHAKLQAEKAQGADPEDPDEYRAKNIFWVPPEARWSRLKAQAKQPTIGQFVDDAMAGIERDNPSLKGVLPREYGRPALDEIRKHGHVLTPGRYVGAEAQEDDGEPFDEKVQRLTATLREQMAEARKLDATIEVNLRQLGYGL